LEPPEELKGYSVAESCWEYHVGLFQTLQGKIVTPLDAHVLIEYCLSWQYLDDLKQVRRKALELKKFDLLLSVDARIDRKGVRLDSLRQQLYMTPRSRAGVAPAEKEPEEPGWAIPPGGFSLEDLLNEDFTMAGSDDNT
jgi:phage terminase small subunit